MAYSTDNGKKIKFTTKAKIKLNTVPPSDNVRITQYSDQKKAKII